MPIFTNVALSNTFNEFRQAHNDVANTLTDLTSAAGSVNEYSPDSLYINGVLVNSGADSYDYTNPYSVYIGRWDGNVISNPGYVIAARMYQNVGLTSDQVRQNFHSLVNRVI
jgi:hypothetical protein